MHFMNEERGNLNTEKPFEHSIIYIHRMWAKQRQFANPKRWSAIVGGKAIYKNEHHKRLKKRTSILGRRFPTSALKFHHQEPMSVHDLWSISFDDSIILSILELLHPFFKGSMNKTTHLQVFFFWIASGCLPGGGDSPLNPTGSVEAQGQVLAWTCIQLLEGLMVPMSQKYLTDLVCESLQDTCRFQTWFVPLKLLGFWSLEKIRRE